MSVKQILLNANIKIGLHNMMRVDSKPVSTISVNFTGKKENNFSVTSYGIYLII